MNDTQLHCLAEIERRVLWLAAWTIHNANHLRAQDEIKVGGHQASSASLASIMTALYFAALRPEDRIPHCVRGCRVQAREREGSRLPEREVRVVERRL